MFNREVGTSIVSVLAEPEGLYAIVEVCVAAPLDDRQQRAMPAPAAGQDDDPSA